MQPHKQVQKSRSSVRSQNPSEIAAVGEQEKLNELLENKNRELEQ